MRLKFVTLLMLLCLAKTINVAAATTNTIGIVNSKIENEHIEKAIEQTPKRQAEIIKQKELRKKKIEREKRKRIAAKRRKETRCWKECGGTFKITCYWIGEDSWGYQTATGIRSRAYETVAVDPNVIPLGSRIKVVFKDGTKRYYHVVDTGSAVKGNVVDVFTETRRDDCWYGAKVYIKR